MSSWSEAQVAHMGGSKGWLPHPPRARTRHAFGHAPSPPALQRQIRARAGRCQARGKGWQASGETWALDHPGPWEGSGTRSADGDTRMDVLCLH